MKSTDIRNNLIDFVQTFAGIAKDPVSGVPLTSAQIIALRVLVVAGTPLNPTQTAQWFNVNQAVVDFAQNGPRPASPYITTHMQLVQRRGSVPYKGQPVLNKSQLATFSGAFNAGNVINFTINGTALPAVNFDTDNATTYNDILSGLQTAFPGASIVIDPVGFTVSIYQPGIDFTMLCTVTDGTPPTVLITAPYTKADTPIYWIEKIMLYLQSYGEGSDSFLQNLQQAVYLEETIAWLDGTGLAYITDTGVVDIHRLIDLTFEERFSYDMEFSVGQSITDVTYDIATESPPEGTIIQG